MWDRAIRGVCDCVSTLNLVYIYSVEVAWHKLTRRSKDQRSRLHAYENHHSRVAASGCFGHCAAASSIGLHIVWLLRFVVNALQLVYCYSAVQKILTKARQLVDVKKDDGFAALHLAALNSHLRTAEALIDVVRHSFTTHLLTTHQLLSSSSSWVCPGCQKFFPWYTFKNSCNGFFVGSANKVQLGIAVLYLYYFNQATRYASIQKCKLHNIYINLGSWFGELLPVLSIHELVYQCTLCVLLRAS